MESKIVNKVGFYSAVFTTILTVITFRIAFMTFTLSGTLCTAGCFSYPFRDIAYRFPEILTKNYFDQTACGTINISSGT